MQRDGVTAREGKEFKMAQYRKKPVVIDAIQFLPALTMDELYEWAGIDRKEDKACPHGFVHFTAADGGIRIQTLEGPLRASPGDWIIRGIKGEFYPCKPDIFTATYELVGPLKVPDAV